MAEADAASPKREQRTVAHDSPQGPKVLAEPAAATATVAAEMLEASTVAAAKEA